jgi:acyl carrier protein
LYLLVYLELTRRDILNEDLTADHIGTAIHDTLQQLLEEQGQELGEISRQSALSADLGLASIDMIHLLITLEDKLEMQLQFDELATGPEGQFRDDLTLGDLKDFIHAKLVGRVPASGV